MLNSKLVIVSNRPGRMGNMLIQYTNLIAFSIHFEFCIFNPAFVPYMHYFEVQDKSFIPMFSPRGLSLTNTPDKILNNRFLPEFILNHLRTIIYLLINSLYRLQIKYQFFNNPIISSFLIDSDKEFILPLNTSKLNTSNGLICLLGGWLLHSRELFAKYQNVIKPLFVPKTKYRNASHSLLCHAKDLFGKSFVIGVHIRQTDYQHFRNGIYYYDSNVYRAYMSFIQQRLDFDVCFILFSDDVISTELFEGIPFEISNNSEIIDLYALSLCDGVIGPPSTFSYFAATFWGKNNIYFIEKPTSKIPDSFFERICN